MRRTPGGPVLVAALPRAGTGPDCYPACSLNKLTFILLCSALPLEKPHFLCPIIARFNLNL